MMLVAAWSAIALGTAGLGYRWRHRTLRLCAMVIVAAVAAVTALLLTGDVAARLVADAAKILVGTVILSILAVLLIVRALPRLSSRRDRGNVILICCALAGGYLFVAMFLTMAADQHLRVGQLPNCVPARSSSPAATAWSSWGRSDGSHHQRSQSRTPERRGRLDFLSDDRGCSDTGYRPSASRPLPPGVSRRTTGDRGRDHVEPAGLALAPG